MKLENYYFEENGGGVSNKPRPLKIRWFQYDTRVNFFYFRISRLDKY